MTDPLSEVMQRRAELLTRVAVQRVQLFDETEQWQARLGLIDKGLNMVRLVRSSPLLLAGAAALFFARRHGVTGMLRGIWLLWKRYRSIRRGAD